MGRVTLRISGTQLLCQDEHPSLLAALESHDVEVEYQCREGYCGSAVPAWWRDRLTGLQNRWPSFSPVKYCRAVAGQKAILK